MKCSKCQFDNPDATNFCGKCGVLLTAEARMADSLTKTLATPLPFISKDSLIAGKYRIIEETGHGGMGVVYKAEDIKLKRCVALKFLPDETAQSPEALDRFLLEARAASALNHPHICTIHEFGQFRGRPFIVMEFLKGQTLRDLIGGQPMGIDQVRELGVQLADALAAAHAEGIIHRDIKPGNIFIVGGNQAKLLDFGLAKKIAGGSSIPAETGLATRSLPEARTEAGIALGTLTYMSPEQARGEDIDARSDLFSFGAVLYEMITGTMAFPGRNTGEIFEAIFTRRPTPIVRLNPGAPEDLSRIIERAMEKDRTLRYPRAADMLEDLKHLPRGGREASTIVSPASVQSHPARTLAMVGTAVVLLSIAALLWQGRGSKSGERGASAVSSSAAPPSIAVLPFADLSASHDQEYFSDGLAEELLNDLAKIPGLRVTARTSSFQFKGKNTELRAIGQKLNVASVLEGSVRKDGQRIRIRAQLTGTRDGVQLWSETYERQLDDIFAVQADIARSVAGALKVALLGDATSARASPTKDLEAYNAYLQGRYFFGRRGKEDLERASAYYTAAIQRDPAYAAAWAGLAEVHHRQADNGYLPVEEGYAMARRETERALALDDKLALAHAEMGWIKRAHDWDWEGADASYQRALALDPGSRAATAGAAVLAFNLGRLDEAITLDSRAAGLDPLSVGTHSNLGYHAYYAGRWEEATAALKKALELNPDFPIARVTLGRVLLTRGRTQEALAEMEREPDPVWRKFGLCLAYHATGRSAEADSALAAFITDHGETMAFQIAEVFAYRGDADKAFEWLDRAYALHDAGMADIKNDPLLKGLEGDRRYAALLKKLRLPL
jgi:serine/threonine protein kinase/Tfp pilus assembly protein PilF